MIKFEEMITLDDYSEHIWNFVGEIENTNDIDGLVGMFYEAYRKPFFKMLNSKNPYDVLTGQKALEYLASITLPSIRNANQAIDKLEKYSKHLVSEYIPAKNDITSNMILEILNYLETNYLYVTKVFKNISPTFAIIDYRNINVNSSCISGKHRDEKVFNFLLFAPSYAEDTMFWHSPEERLFYLLAKALYINLCGTAKPFVMPELIQSLNDYYKGLESFSANQQLEAIYNILAMGLMYNSGFNTSDFLKMLLMIKKNTLIM